MDVQNQSPLQSCRGSLISPQNVTRHCCASSRRLGTATLDFRELRDRKFDLVIARIAALLETASLGEDLLIEKLFDDRIVVVAAVNSKWARRKAPSPDRRQHADFVLEFAGRNVGVLPAQRRPAMEPVDDLPGHVGLYGHPSHRARAASTVPASRVVAAERGAIRARQSK